MNGPTLRSKRLAEGFDPALASGKLRVGVPCAVSAQASAACEGQWRRSKGPSGTKRPIHSYQHGPGRLQGAKLARFAPWHSASRQLPMICTCRPAHMCCLHRPLTQKSHGPSGILTIGLRTGPIMATNLQRNAARKDTVNSALTSSTAMIMESMESHTTRCAQGRKCVGIPYLADHWLSRKP